MRLTKKEQEVLKLCEMGKGHDTPKTGEAMRGRRFTLQSLTRKGLIYGEYDARLTKAGQDRLWALRRAEPVKLNPGDKVVHKDATALVVGTVDTASHGSPWVMVRWQSWGAGTSVRARDLRRYDPDVHGVEGIHERRIDHYRRSRGSRCLRERGHDGLCVEGNHKPILDRMHDGEFSDRETYGLSFAVPGVSVPANRQFCRKRADRHFEVAA